MNLLNINFDELYRRHLCRHSELGINIMHLIAVAGIYVALFGIAFACPGGQWLVGSVLTVYFGIIAFNIPFRVLVANTIAISLLLCIYWALPEATPVWVHILMIPVWHRFQNWNHRIYHKEHDMSDYSRKYKKGFTLFFLLAIYELPILLNYLIFDRRNWATYESQATEQEVA